MNDYMEKYNPEKINIEALKADYFTKLKVAADNAINKKAYDKFTNYQISSFNPIRLFKDLKEFKRLQEQINKSSVHVETIAEFKLLLDVLRDRLPDIGLQNWDKVIETVAHENAHMNVAQQHSLESRGYEVVFYELDNKEIAIVTGAVIPDILKDASLEDLNIMEKILKAPETYGQSLPLSTDGIGANQADTEVLEYIQKKRDELIARNQSTKS
jgi:hypothetical protein